MCSPSGCARLPQTVVSALNPIDLIPDFIPVLGYKGDLLIMPIGIALTIDPIPWALMTHFRLQARTIIERPTSRSAVLFILPVRLLVSIWAGRWILRYLA